ncbi:MAG: cytochrome c oxidase accessory protein CcoG [Mitsuaria chitosanitabida]|uniref:cytochrome c oxidase accessory protein CcoG n=1 Tax=Roseateles chitosanitabidus TaxID=65048 RepID=UPI001B2F34A7|nr:cytochrome c oxidase accessory protein CcoG [Roseateles chitosanitabidus]MBO9685033.1 cytochrome c oxidase accessory protein CcoG [Roseateles chitosanitabidus]
MTGRRADAGARPEPRVIRLYEAEAKIYPRAVHGWFAVWRWVLVWATQALFYGLPWLNWNGRQAVLFDLDARRFLIFDLILYPQDFIYLTALLVVSAFGLFFFTAVAGRLWCGYACPQTVYTEIFLWIERRIEGDRAARIRLDKSGWGAEKLLRKGGKHAAWIAVSLWTGFTFVGYFEPIRALGQGVLGGALGGWEIFWVLFYGFATYGNAGYLREQVCKYMCPYARFQSAMFDKDTLIISYDAARGDPRGPRSKKVDPATAGLGSCVDCAQCVHVCPTGIDIRQGLQYECIGCAACIDVCNDVMDKFGYERGLIRYATQNGIDKRWTAAQQWRRVLRPRVLIYGAILMAVSTALVWSLAMRMPFKVDVVRDRATLARQIEDGVVENLYRLQLMNAAESTQRFRLDVTGIDGLTVGSPRGTLTLAPAEARWITVSLRLSPEAAARAGGGVHPMHFRIERLAADGNGGVVADRSLLEKSTFVVPR